MQYVRYGNQMKKRFDSTLVDVFNSLIFVNNAHFMTITQKFVMGAGKVLTNLTGDAQEGIFGSGGWRKEIN